MASQTLEFSAATGLTISCKLFAVGSDVVVATAVASEKVNDKNRYSVTFTDVPVGAYRLNGFVNNVPGYANELYDLTLTTATFQPRSEQLPDTSGVTTILGKLTGITSLANWLRAMARQTGADATALSEINSGGGSYKSKHSLEGIRRKQGAGET